MLCNVCKDGLEGMWDPASSKRLGLEREFKKEYLGRRAEVAEQTPQGGPQVHSLDKAERQEFENYIYGHHVDETSLLRSRQEGCVVCYLFAPPSVVKKKIEKLDYISVFSVSLKEGKLIMVVYSGGALTYFDLVPVGEPKYDSNLKFELGPLTSDPGTWSMIHRWFTTCFESHDSCRKPETSTSYMPTRVLEVDHSKSPQTFRLVKGSACPLHSQYVTLSHCWGKNPNHQALQLLKSTVNELCNKQPVNSLPKTFIDAINIAKRFGIHYIWIDRLCIHQDSAEEWRQEASTMQYVYQNALLNISALGAEDDNGGCFFSRNPSKVAPTIVRLKLEEDGDPRPFRFSYEKNYAWHVLFTGEPLVQRGWVVQERLLAPRILHFGRSQVFWECSEAICCETHPNGVYIFDNDDEDEQIIALTSRERGRGGNARLWKQLLNASVWRHVADPYEQLFLDWDAIVDLYAKCELSVASDKLVALSGLANDMKRRLQELKSGTHRYLAGHWEEKLPENLTWHAIGPAHRASEYRAPSWAWACLDGRLGIGVNGHVEDQFTCACLISAEMQFASEDDTGEVESGTITLTGPCAVVQVGHPDISLPRWPNWCLISSFHNPYDGNSIGQDDNEHENMNDRPFVTNTIFDTLDDIQSEVFCLVTHAEQMIGGDWEILGLALTLIDGNMYRRVGFTSCWFSSKDKAQGFLEKFPRQQIKII